MRACQKGHVDVVDRLISVGVDVNVQNNDGKTALMLACQNNHLEIVKILLDSNVDPEMEDEDEKKAKRKQSTHRHIRSGREVAAYTRIGCYPTQKSMLS